jgi:hypothetical protein
MGFACTGSIVLVACFVGDGPDGDSGHGSKGGSTGFDYNAIASHQPARSANAPTGSQFSIPISLFLRQNRANTLGRGG